MLTHMGYRESIREHTAMNEEIAQAMAAPANTIDEDEELEEELERMRQEQLDEEMLKTGSVPVDRVSNLPAAANGERKSMMSLRASMTHPLTVTQSRTSRHRWSRRRRPSCASCRRRWPCKGRTAIWAFPALRVL
jgi:hypothetical protein